MAKEVLPQLATKTTASILDKSKNNNGQGVERSGKAITLFILNEDIDDVIKIVGPYKNSGLLIDSAPVTVKYEIKKIRKLISWCFYSPYSCFIDRTHSFFIQPMVSSLINAIPEKEVIRAGKGEKGGFLPLLALPLITKVLGKGVTRA